LSALVLAAQAFHIFGATGFAFLLFSQLRCLTPSFGGAQLLCLPFLQRVKQALAPRALAATFQSCFPAPA
jgi:hypothetical protein